MRKIQLFALLTVLVVGMTSCKYEEGPLISFIPKVERVTNTWVVNEAVKNGTPSTSIDGFKQITFYKEGGCNIIWNPLGFDIAYTGTWAFDAKKDAIIIATADELSGTAHYDSEWTILHLKEEELKVSYTDGSDAYIVTFETAI